MMNDLDHDHDLDDAAAENGKRWIMGLSTEDRRLLLVNAMLNDLHIGAAHSLLLKKFEQLDGCQLTLLGQSNKFKPVSVHGPSVQIHHDGRMHWMASGSIGKSVVLLDSLAGESLCASMQQQLACIYKKFAVNDVLTVKRLSVQQQKGGTDCGLFCMAFLYTLCTGSIDFCHYEQSKMRSHLNLCISNGELLPFPTSPAKKDGCREKTFNIPLFCKCRMPECLDDMVQCDKCQKWYHFACTGWNGQKDFICSDCFTLKV